MTSELLISRNISLIGEEIVVFQDLVTKLIEYIDKSPVGFSKTKILELTPEEITFVKQLYDATFQDGISFTSDDSL